MPRTENREVARNGDAVVSSTPRAIKAMSEELPETSKQSRKTNLAAALAGRMSVNKWAARNGAPRRTACNWSRAPDVQSTKETIG